MAEILDRLMYCTTIRSNTNDAGDRFAMVMTTHGRTAYTIATVALADKSYVITVYDALIIDFCESVFYISNWKYRDVGSADKTVVSASWNKCKEYIAEFANDDYVMCKIIHRVLVGADGNIQLSSWDHADVYKKFEFDEKKVLEVLSECTDNAIDHALVELVNRLVDSTQSTDVDDDLHQDNSSN